MNQNIKKCEEKKKNKPMITPEVMAGRIIDLCKFDEVDLLKVLECLQESIKKK